MRKFKMVNNVEEELVNLLANGISNEIDKLICRHIMGIIDTSYILTFIDKRYDYPQQRVRLEILESKMPSGKIEVKFNCNRDERTFEDYVLNFDNWSHAEYIKNIEGNISYFFNKLNNIKNSKQNIVNKNQK